MKVKVEEVVFRKDLYPRLETSAATVQKYAEDLDVLPPIEVNQHKELIDGWHRWTAHKKREAADIEAKVTKTSSDAELLELAIERNATHGLQLSQLDKKNVAVTIYNGTPDKDKARKKESLAKLLSVGLSTVQAWLSRADKDSKEKRDKKICDLWLACWSQEEIAEEVGLVKGQVSQICSENLGLEKLNKSDRAEAEHATDFDAPIYNIWKQQDKSNKVGHFGNTEARWLDNLLYLYTDPFDVVIDPFAGGGSTIDVCKKRFRRYFVSDRKPIIEREAEIREHDVTAALPKPPRWEDVRLVYLDPPYWKQAEGQYSKDKEDLANMTLDDFNRALAGVINGFLRKLKESKGGHLALVMQPTQWKSPGKQFTDHIGDMLRAVKYPVAMRISAPYESQQCTPQMVEWAKENKTVLVLTREIVVWKAE